MLWTHLPKPLYTHTRTAVHSSHPPGFSLSPSLSFHGAIIKNENLQAQSRTGWWGEKKTEWERYFEMCLIFTLGGRAKCDSSLNSSQSSLQVQPSTVELKPLSTWLKHENTPCGVMGSVIKLLPHNGINYVEEQSKTFLAFAMLLNYFIWTNWASFAISDWDNYKLSMEDFLSIWIVGQYVDFVNA